MIVPSGWQLVLSDGFSTVHECDRRTDRQTEQDVDAAYKTNIWRDIVNQIRQFAAKMNAYDECAFDSFATYGAIRKFVSTDCLIGDDWLAAISYGPH